jgi:hypothetical protein
LTNRVEHSECCRSLGLGWTIVGYPCHDSVNNKIMRLLERVRAWSS